MSDVAELLEEAAVKLASAETELSTLRSENDQLKHASASANQAFLREIEKALEGVAPLIGIGETPVAIKNAAVAVATNPGGLAHIMTAVKAALVPAPSPGHASGIRDSSTTYGDLHRSSLSKWVGNPA